MVEKGEVLPYSSATSGRIKEFEAPCVALVLENAPPSLPLSIWSTDVRLSLLNLNPIPMTSLVDMFVVSPGPR